MSARTAIHRLEHFNCERLRSSSYFIQGFLDLASDRGIAFKIRNGPPPSGFPELQPLGIRSPFSVFRAFTNRSDFYFCVDGRDGNDSFRQPYLEKCRYYFKVNYNSEVLAGEPELSTFGAEILPAIPHFPIRTTGMAAYLPRLRPAKSGFVPVLRHNWRRFGHWRSAIPLRDITALRPAAKERDLLFVAPFYDQSAHRETNEFRYEVMKAIRAHAGIHSLFGFAAERVTGKYAEFHIPHLSSKEHFERMARSRLLVYVRGAHGCISYKFGEMLALGVPIVGQTLLNNAEALMRHEHFEAQFAWDDPEQIARAAADLLSDPARLQRIGAANARTFDRYLSPRAAAASILDWISLREAARPADISAIAPADDELGRAPAMRCHPHCAR